MSATGGELVRYLRTLAAGRGDDSCTDRQLLEQFVTRREETSFAALVRRHGPMVLSVCRRILGHDQDAEDAFQATFLVLSNKAGSIRRHESISSWLHGVAFHVAQRLRAQGARRAAHERKAVSRPSVDPVDDVAWREIRCLLDSELARLPECYRGPLVLCYLQGKTQDEAARQLDWSLRTFRRRLMRARDLLVRRLARRGVTLSAALSAPLLADAGAQAALPPLLVANTVRAGLASALGNTIRGIVSDQVIALAEGGVASLLAKKASIVVIVLATLTLGIGGLLATRAVQDRTLAEAPAALPREGNERDAERRNVRSHAPRGNEMESLEVHGVVRGPDGKAIEGAKIYCGYTKTEMKRQIVTDAGGHYRFMLRRDDMDPKGYNVDPWEWAPIVAVADGYGLDWKHLRERDADNRLDLHLVADDAPIQGRILDLEGRPIVGATVRILRLHATSGGDLSNLLKQWAIDPHRAVTGSSAVPRMMMDGGKVTQENPPISWRRLWWVSQTGLFPPTTTDKAGKFRITGLGRERFVELLISGPGIEESQLRVVTRKNVDAKALSKPSPEYFRNFGDDIRRLFPWPTLYGATFEHAAAPTKPIAGIVRDKSSGKPLAGIRILGHSPSAKVGQFWPQHIETVTDAQGAYRLTGLPKDRQYSLLVGASQGMNYLPAMKNLLDSEGLGALKADFELERGILVEGRLLDKVSGKPVAGVVHYAPLPSNPRITAQQRGALSQFIVEKHFVGKDGAFQFVAYPGPGVVSGEAATGDYIGTPFTVEEQKLGLGDQYLRVAGMAVEVHKQAHRPIDPDAKTEAMKCDLYFQRRSQEREP